VVVEAEPAVECELRYAQRDCQPSRSAIRGERDQYVEDLASGHWSLEDAVWQATDVLHLVMPGTWYACCVFDAVTHRFSHWCPSRAVRRELDEMASPTGRAPARVGPGLGPSRVRPIDQSLEVGETILDERAIVFFVWIGGISAIRAVGWWACRSGTTSLVLVLTAGGEPQ
jgi:hypothetical protein